MFGVWNNGDISNPLMTVFKNGSLVSYSNRVVWLGNRTAASFQLLNVSITDDHLYGCKLDFDAFTVRDSFRLIVIGKRWHWLFIIHQSWIEKKKNSNNNKIKYDRKFSIGRINKLWICSVCHRLGVITQGSRRDQGFKVYKQMTQNQYMIQHG